MKTEFVYDYKTKATIKDIDDQIAERVTVYTESMKRARCTYELQRLADAMKDDPLILHLQKVKAHILETSICSVIVTAETEEEKRLLAERYKNGVS